MCHHWTTKNAIEVFLNVFNVPLFPQKSQRIGGNYLRAYLIYSSKPIGFHFIEEGIYAYSNTKTYL